MQPAHRSDDRRSIGMWLFEGMSAKALIVASLGLAGAYYGTQGKLGIGEERDRATQAEIREQRTTLNDRIDEAFARLGTQLTALQTVRETTLRKDTYDRDQQRLDSLLRDLSERQRTTDTVLMQRGLHAR